MTQNIFKSTVASQLKQARRTAKLTQKSLAEIVGVSIPTIRQTWSVPYCRTKSKQKRMTNLPN